MKKFHTTLLTVATLVLVTACSKLTEDNLQKVHNGMSTAEVKEILGTPSDIQTSNVMNVVTGTTYTYHSGSSDVKINFVDDKVIATEGEFK